MTLSINSLDLQSQIENDMTLFGSLSDDTIRAIDCSNADAKGASINLADLHNQTLSALKSLALKLNAKVDGDRRLRATWESAIALAQSAGDAINAATGCQLGRSFGTVARSSVEAYGIARNQFVMPVERTIAWTWNAATSEPAIALYLKSAVTLMRFCFAIYKSGMIARDWCEALIDECLEPDEELWMLPILEEHAIASVKRFAAQCVDRLWLWDAQYQSAIVWAVDEARSVFSVSQWVLTMVG